MRVGIGGSSVRLLLGVPVVVSVDFWVGGGYGVPGVPIARKNPSPRAGSFSDEADFVSLPTYRCFPA